MSLAFRAVTISKESNFVNIGENKCYRFQSSENWLKKIILMSFCSTQQVESGAIIDINMDDGLIDGVESMVHLNLIASEPEISKVPIMIDSQNGKF